MKLSQTNTNPVEQKLLSEICKHKENYKIKSFNLNTFNTRLSIDIELNDPKVIKDFLDTFIKYQNTSQDLTYSISHTIE